MSDVQVLPQPQEEERKTSPAPERISTNNPFRRGTGSPGPRSPGVPGSPSRRPASSRNPFLDGAAPPMDTNKSPRTSASPPRPVRTRPTRSPTESQGLLANMSLDDPLSPEENGVPRNGHRPSRSQEGHPRPEGPNGPPGPGPGRRPMPRGPPRPRRNSDTSVNERKSEGADGSRRGPRPPGSTRRGPAKDSQGRSIPQKEHRSKKANRRLDVIDRLDLTGIYGEGMFHHDGPFDACNPHRNRKGHPRAPMSAFAADSLNNAIGGSGPLRKDVDLDRIHGRQEDSFNDFSMPAITDSQPQYEPYIPGMQARRGQVRDGVDRTSRFDPTSKVERLHGDESLGLGTSTFLEGTPAPQSVIQRRESEGDANGLTRKKSLAQRIRGISNARPRGYSGSGGLSSPEARASPEVQSAGGLGRISERNPFFEDHDAAYAKKGASIQAEAARAGKSTAARGSSEEAATTVPVVDKDQEAFSAVPRSSSASVGASTGPAPAGSTTLTRAVTDGSQVPTMQAPEEGKREGGGFMNRVKSLRGGKRDKSKGLG